MQPRGEESDDGESSDDGEEAGRILKKVNFPDVGKKPQDSCMAVSSCLQKRLQKLQPLVDKLDSMQDLTASQEKNLAQLVYPMRLNQPALVLPTNLRYKDSVKTVISKLTELDDALTTIYSNGIAVGFSKESLVSYHLRATHEMVASG